MIVLAPSGEKYPSPALTIPLGHLADVLQNCGSTELKCGTRRRATRQLASRKDGLLHGQLLKRVNNQLFSVGSLYGRDLP